MLTKVTDSANTRYVDFSAITVANSLGVGRCYVYNAVMKRSRSGNQFVTLYMRDLHGATLPGYVFNLDSPVLAGLDVGKVIGSVVEIEWEENYLQGYGMSLKVHRVSIVKDVTPEELSLFTGKVQGANQMLEEITKFVATVFNINIVLPGQVKTMSVLGYSRGKVGGLTEHYWKMYNIIKNMKYLGDEEFRRLVGTYVLFICIHYGMLDAEQNNRNDINFLLNTIRKMAPIIDSLGLGEGARELTAVIFKQQPKDIYAKTVVSISNLVKQVDNDFEVYQTLPLTQEGDAGYGTIRRYAVEYPHE